MEDLSTPENLTAIRQGETQKVNLEWTLDGHGTSDSWYFQDKNFNVYRRLSGTTEWEYLGVAGAEPAYFDATAEVLNGYDYMVRYGDGTGAESADSNIASVSAVEISG